MESLTHFQRQSSYPSTSHKISYILFLYKILTKVSTIIEKPYRSFLWKRGNNQNGMNLVRWDKIIKPLSHGWLGIQGIGDKNRALLPKWISGYYHKGVALWKQILLMLKYGEHTDSSWPNTSFPDHIEGPWRTILSHLNLIEERVSIKVGNGNRASFWHNHWINEAPISNLFPRLCTLAAYKQSTVNNFWDEQHGWTWTITYRRNFKEDEFEEWMALVFLMEFGWPPGEKWIWNLDKNGLFSTKSLANNLGLRGLHRTPSLWTWCYMDGFLPKKSSILSQGN